VYLKQTYNKVCIRKHLSDAAPILNNLKQMPYHHCFIIQLGRSRKI